MRFSWSPGVSSFSFSATATYSSYGVTMKQVWVKSATCACTASTTRGAALPTDVDRDAGAEVDQLVAVDVDDDAAAGRARRRPAASCRHPADDRGCLARVQFHRARARDRGLQHAALLDRHNLTSIVKAMPRCCA